MRGRFCGTINAELNPHCFPKRGEWAHMEGHGRNHGTKTHAKTRKRHLGETMVRVRGRRYTHIDMDEAMERRARRHKNTHMDGHGRNHGTKTHAKPRKRHLGGTMVRGRGRGRARGRRYTHRHGRSHGETSTTTQETHTWMNMDGTMGRRRTQSLANNTWAGPWYEYEYEYDDGRRYTHSIDMDETMEGRARQHKQHTHG